MFSKFDPKKILQMVLSTALLFSLGCGLKTGEKKPEPVPAQVKSAVCLNQAITDLKIYFKGEASTAQVESSLSCLEEVFVVFKDNIRGQHKNAFTAREITTFIEMNFLNEKNTIWRKNQSRFSDDFLQELMFFKVALFGGDNAVISKSEIDSIVNLVGNLKPDLVALNPDMKILTFEGVGILSALDEATKEKRFLAAKARFQNVVSKLTAEFAATNRPYQINRLLGFVTEILKFAGSQPDTIDTVQKAGSFLKNFKAHLIGSGFSLQGAEWKKLGMTLHEVYFQALRAEYFLKDLKDLGEKQTEKKWAVYEKVALDLAHLIENLLKTKETHQLTNKQMIEILQPLGVLIPKISEISEEMLDRLGDIKVTFLGDSEQGRELALDSALGSRTSSDQVAGNRAWSESDFAALQRKIPVLFSSLATILNTLEALKPTGQGVENRTGLSYVEFSEVEKKALHTVGELSQLIEMPYDLESLRQLIVLLAKGPLRGSLILPDRFEQFCVVAIAAKELLTGEGTSTVSATNLKLLLNVGARAYLNYAEYDLFLSGYATALSQAATNLPAEFFAGLERLWPKVKTTLVTELNLRTGHVISTPEWVKFIFTLQQQNTLTTALTQNSLTQAFDALWSHLLNRPEDRLQSIFRPGFDVITLEQIAPEIETALGLQRHIAQIFSSSDRFSKDSLSTEFQNHMTREFNPGLKKALTDMMGFLAQPISLTLNDQGMLKILESSAVEYRVRDLTLSNIARVIGRLLIRSYATDMTRVTQLSAVTEEEVQVAYTQLKPLAVDLDVVDVSNNTFVKSRFLEANLFLSVSDGDKLASFKELHHLIIHIFSGFARAGEIKKDIVKNCIPPDENGATAIKGRTKVSENCLLQQYSTHVAGFTSMPKFSEMKTTYTTEQVQEYALNLLKAAGHVVKDDGTVFMSDADLFPHVVQYIEMLYARHDTSQDGLLQKDEALAAFPIFENLLAELVQSYKQIKPEDLPGVFIYILKYGRPPNPKSIGEVLKFVAFIKDKEQKDWTINSTRLELGKILNYIADATLNTPQASVKSAAP